MKKSDKFFISSLLFGSMMLLAATSNGVSNTFEVYAVDNCDPTSTCENIPGTGTGNSQTNTCTDFSNCRNEATGNDNTQTNRCDSVPDPGCVNIADGNDDTQNTDCESVGDGGCINTMDGNDNTQSINCESVGAQPGCLNLAGGHENTQNMKCLFVGDEGCQNLVSADTDEQGNDNTQNMDCLFVRADCVNSATGDENTQNLLCARMTSCTNVIGSIETPIDSNIQSTTCANAGSCLNVGENTNVLTNGADCESHDPDTTTYCQPGRTRILPNP